MKLTSRKLYLLFILIFVVTIACAWINNGIRRLAVERERAMISIIVYLRTYRYEHGQYPNPEESIELKGMLREFGKINGSPGLKFEPSNELGYVLSEETKSFRGLFSRDTLIADGIYGLRWKSSGDVVEIRPRD